MGSTTITPSTKVVNWFIDLINFAPGEVLFHIARWWPTCIGRIVLHCLTKHVHTRHLAGLAQAFFERGVENYIGTGWPVDDAAALEFAKVFYAQALSGEELGSSLSKAREAILTIGSTWGAYQHYGQATAKLITLSGRNAGGELES